MKKLLLLISIISVSSSAVFGQSEGSVVSATARAGVATTFVTDYQTIGINPGNLGLRSKYETKHVTFGFLEMNATAFAKGVTTKQLNDYFFSGNTLTPAEQTTAANAFAGNNMSMNADVMLFGIAYQSDKLGGLAFSLKAHTLGNGNLDQNFTNLAFSGGLSTEYFDKLKLNNGSVVPNDPSQYGNYQAIGIDSSFSTNGVSLGTVFKNTTVKSHFYSTINAAYGKEVFRNDVFHVVAGIGLKYVMGYYYMNMQSVDGHLQGKVVDNPALSALSENFNLPDTNQDSFTKPSGHGFGVDLGGTIVIYDKIKIGISLVNLGSIKYKNAYDVLDTTIYKLNYDASTADAFNETVFWKKAESFKVSLPTTFRLGGSLALFENRLEVGADIIVPLNKEAGNINTPTYALGGDFYLKRWFKLASGVSIGGNFANKIDQYSTHVAVPFGFTFIAGENGGWEAGLATRDIISLFDMNGKGPLYSVGMCMFRFRV
jgi:hypothetical protein